jgi:hypothetical protein
LGRVADRIFLPRISHFRIPDFFESLFRSKCAGCNLLQHSANFRGFVLRGEKTINKFMHWIVAVSKHIHIVPASSVHLDPTDAAKSITNEVTENETSPGKNQICIRFSLFDFGCELYGRAKATHQP